MDLPEVEDFAALLCSDTPMLDVRAPVEFDQGAFLHSQNAPLLNDREREQVGTCYKNQGRDAAIALGAKLISDDIKAARVASWQLFLKAHPNGVLYCFRGGMRSRIAQQWIYEKTGKLVPRVKGGYKALRRYLIEETKRLAEQSNFLLISGRTGSGKTHLLQKFVHVIDLEGLANHRGSSIGRQIKPQPSQINFENNVAVALLKLHCCGVSEILLEDESPNIGSIHIPHALYDAMCVSPCVVLNTPLQARVQIILQEYVIGMLERYIAHEQDEERGFAAFSGYLKSSLERIKRRLGYERYEQILTQMQAALDIQQSSDEIHAHTEWIVRMLTEYYDPMYDYQRDKRKRHVEKSASFNEIIKYLKEYQ